MMSGREKKIFNKPIEYDMISIKDIVVKKEYYPRINLDEATIARYQEQYELGESLPPLIIQKERHILIDGLHRLEAQKRLGWEEIEVELRDITEDEIYLTSIELNRRHGLPFSMEDRDEQIRKMRFEFDPPSTYIEIGQRVGLSMSRVGEICREMEFKINGTIIPKVDIRRSITPKEAGEIQERLDAGESTSDVAKDYPVGESRISQLKKEPRRAKPYKDKKTKKLSQMPRSWIRRNIEKRFKANNPMADIQEIDFTSHLTVNDFDSYHDLIGEMKKIHPEYEWYYPEERPLFNKYYNLPSFFVFEKSIEIRVNL